MTDGEKKELIISMSKVAFTLNDDMTASVTAPLFSDSFIRIQEEIVFKSNQYLVTAVQKLAFRQSMFVEVVLPRTVEVIGPYAFSFSKNLRSISIPFFTKRIEAHAFEYCPLHNIRFDDHSRLEFIGDYAFAGTEFTSVSLPEHVKMLSKGVFAGSCLKHLILQQNVSLMNSLTFKYAHKLVEIAIHPHNKFFVNQSGVVFSRIKPEIIFFPRIKTHFCVRESVLRIPKYAFERSKIMQVSLPSSLVLIEKKAFFQCSSLKSINIPKNVRNIDKLAFALCGCLKNIRFHQEIALNRITLSAFYSCILLKSLVLPESLINIDSKAFDYCSSLRRVVFLSKNRLEIGENAFGTTSKKCKFFKFSSCTIKGLNPKTHQCIDIV